jgi:hypothetical protein
MKKIIFFATALLAMAACSKDEIGGTAMESMAGQWYCTVDAVDDNGNIITQTPDGTPNYGEDYWGVGRTLVLTYNVAANNSTQMWVNIMGIGNFASDYNTPRYPDYDFITKVNCNQGTLTFSSNESENIAEPVVWTDEDEDGNEIEVARVDPMPVSIEGKILKGAGRQNNGSPADSIIMYVKYKDDPWVPDDGYTKYKISGIRYSGLEEND